MELKARASGLVHVVDRYEVEREIPFPPDRSLLKIDEELKASLQAEFDVHLVHSTESDRSIVQ